MSGPLPIDAGFRAGIRAGFLEVDIHLGCQKGGLCRPERAQACADVALERVGTQRGWQYRGIRI